MGLTYHRLAKPRQEETTAGLNCSRGLFTAVLDRDSSGHDHEFMHASRCDAAATAITIHSMKKLLCQFGHH